MSEMETGENSYPHTNCTVLQSVYSIVNFPRLLPFRIFCSGCTVMKFWSEIFIKNLPRGGPGLAAELSLPA